VNNSILSLIIKDLKHFKSWFTSGLILYIPTTLLAIIQPLIIGYAVQHALSLGIHKIINYTLLFILVVILLSICELIQSYCLQRCGQGLVAHLRQQAFIKAQRLSMAFIDTTPLGKILTRLTNDAESVAELFSLGAVQIIGDLLFLAGTIIMLLVVDIKLTFYSFIIMPILALGIYFFRLWTKRAFIGVRAVLSELNGFLHEYLSGIQTVQIAQKIKRCEYDFSVYNNDYLNAHRQAIFLEAAIYSFVDALSYVASAAVLWGAFRLQLEHALELGVLVAFLEALMRFFQPLREMANRYAVFESALVSLQRIYELFSWPEEPHDIQSSRHNFYSSIEFKDVSFAYKDNYYILKNISLRIKKGERIAFVGQTGAGKSTVIKLLNRFYKIQSGEILIDNININSWALADLRKIIALVAQEVFLFNTTLRNNLLFGASHKSDEDLWHALRITQLYDLVKERGGLDMIISSRAANFSLGERQLIAFARALIADTPIIILDEATAGVDAATEYKLKIATRALLQNRTAIIIAHRLSTIIDADRIVVFEDGSIIEEGAHEDLMAKNGSYARMIKLQYREATL
jgi:ATP-binding cassette subfamily B protein